VEIDAEKEESGDEFDDGVTGSDARVAAAAASAEDEPAEHGNIVVGSDGGVARRAGGARGDYGESAGKTIDADVEETAEAESEEKSGRTENVVEVERSSHPNIARLSAGSDEGAWALRCLRMWRL
jgi:hypothetical protein